MESDEIEAAKREVEYSKKRFDEICDARREFRADLSYRRKHLAALRKQAKAKKPTADALLTDAQRKIAELRIATAKALRDRGATIAEVEAVIGIRYSNVKDAEQRLARR